MASTMKHQKYLFYFILITFNFFNFFNSWMSPFILGLSIAEAANDGYFIRLQNSYRGYIVKFLLLSTGVTAIAINYFVLLEPGYSILDLWFNSYTFGTNAGAHAKPEYNQLSAPDLIIGGCLMLLVELSSSLRFIFGFPPIYFLGKVSFGVYLIHPIIATSFSSYMISKSFDPSAGLSYDHAVFQVMISLFAVLLPISWVFYKVADKNSVKFGRFVERFVFQAEWSRANFSAWFQHSLDSLKCGYSNVKSLTAKPVEQDDEIV